jgi:hypothetical protein
MAMSDASADQPGEPGWHPDPLGRFDHRYFDGRQWTDQVSTGGVVSTDPVTQSPAPDPAPDSDSPVGDGATRPDRTPGGRRLLPWLVGAGVVVLLAVVVIVIVAGGGDDESADDPSMTDTTTPAEDADEDESSSDEAGDDGATPTTADATSDFDRYASLADAYGVPPTDLTDESEAPSVASNLCDNLVEDFVFLLQTAVENQEVLGDPEVFAAEKAAMVDAYCPEARPRYEAAADQVGIPLPAAVG